jgi:hypothetical protein
MTTHSVVLILAATTHNLDSFPVILIISAVLFAMLPLSRGGCGSVTSTYQLAIRPYSPRTSRPAYTTHFQKKIISSRLHARTGVIALL